MEMQKYCVAREHVHILFDVWVQELRLRRLKKPCLKKLKPKDENASSGESEKSEWSPWTRVNDISLQ